MSVSRCASTATRSLATATRTFPWDYWHAPSVASLASQARVPILILLLHGAGRQHVDDLLARTGAPADLRTSTTDRHRASSFFLGGLFHLLPCRRVAGPQSILQQEVHAYVFLHLGRIEWQRGRRRPVGGARHASRVERCGSAAVAWSCAVLLACLVGWGCWLLTSVSDVGACIVRRASPRLICCRVRVACLHSAS
jgi:hypothetical protein